MPWRGYFSQILNCHNFVFLDNVQFTHRDWRTRNRIKTPTGLSWITVPITHPNGGMPSIDQISIFDNEFIDNHLEQVRRNYSRAPYFNIHWEWFNSLFKQSFNPNLSKFNQSLVTNISKEFNIHSIFHNARDFPNYENASDRLVGICRELNATKYLTGPSAKSYLEISKFHESNIEVEWINYNYKPYKQLWSEKFEPQVSIIDLIFNMGTSSINLEFEKNE